MQTIINATPAIGIPGEWVNTNLRRLDSLQAAIDVTLGALAAIKDGKAVAVGTSGATTVKGVFATTHQHVAANGPTDAYRPTLVVRAGDEIGLATMGDIFVAVNYDATATAVTGSGTSKEAAEADARKKLAAALNGITQKYGDKIYYKADGTFTAASASATEFGTVVLASEEGVALSDEGIDEIFTVTGTGSATSWTAAVALKTGKHLNVTVGVRIG